jgi:putative hemin transport protein
MPTQTLIDPTDDLRQIADLQQRHQLLVSNEPRLRIRDRATRLQVSEASLVAAQCGLTSIELSSRHAAPMQTIFRDIGTLGPVMALSRNEWCVHERHGQYLDIQADGPVGIVLGPDIDLRMFFSQWRYCYAVDENQRRSLQFFDGSGSAVHKVYLTEASDSAAFDALIERYTHGERRLPSLQTIAVTPEKNRPDDAAELRAAWLAMTDTHDFFAMLRKFGVSRLGALNSVGADLAQNVGRDAAETMLLQAAASGVSIMCFVANRGIVQIHTGPIVTLQRTGPWFNVLDAQFNLHLNTTAIASCWVVNKPTSDGWVTALEVYAEDGSMIVQFFGARKPGKPELTAWRSLLVALCSEALAG